MKAKYSFGLAILSGILLLLSFPPFDLEFLAWFALVPVLTAIYYERRLRKVPLLGIVAMAIVFVPQWFEIWYTEMEFWLPVSLTWVGYPVAVLVGFLIASVWGSLLASWKPACLPSSRLKYLPTGLWVIVLPILWVSVEFLIMSIPLVMKVGGGFGYASISGTQWQNVPVLQIASYTGMYGVTFLIILTNCAIAYAIVHLKDYKRACAPAITMAVIIGVVFTWGYLSIPPPSHGSISVAIIQKAESFEYNRSSYIDSMSESLNYEPRMLLLAVSPRAADLGQLEGFSREHGVYLLQGTELLSPDRTRQHYDMPYHMISLLRGFRPWQPSEIVSPQIDSLNTEFGKVGCLICMESAYPTPARKLVEGGAQVITTVSANQGFAMAGLLGGNAVYRAVEFRTPAISYRAWGGSVIIDPYGRIIEDLAPGDDIVAGKLAFGDGSTFYSGHGDIFGYVVLLLALALVAYNFYLSRKSTFRYCEACGAEVAKGSETCQQCGVSQIKPPLWKRILLHEYYEHVDRYKKQK